MKSLSLYIDKWYIVGAICSGGVSRPLSLSNNEDRIWLFFHEDIDNDTISYGKGYKCHFFNRENHYYGDVFSIITNADATFTRFKRRQQMKHIFKSSNIFDDLHAAMEENGQVKTFLSFSKDISLAARLLFMEQMKSANFYIEESVARIELLALEYAVKCNGLSDDGYYLTLNACNENLKYSLYQRSEDLFVRIKDDVMEGMGLDLRGRCLIEYVIDNINRTEHFLKGKEECEREYLRQGQYVDDWIVKLTNARPHIPIQISNITLSKDPYKTYSVQVKKELIDQKTEVIVKSVIDDIASFVTNAHVRQEQLRGILFLGNTLTNRQFSEQIQNHFNIPDRGILQYRDCDLSMLVGAYSFIDCDQFKDLTTKFTGDAQAELQRIQNLKEEADAQKKAEADVIEAAKQKKEREEEERKYKDAMENGYRSEQERDYDNMADYFKIAHEKHPDDDEAKQKYEEALRLKAEESVRMNNYKEKIKQAKQAYNEKDYETARQKAIEALSAYPESKEAKKIRENSEKALKQSKEFDRYIDRADSFIAQNLYDVALEELRKARLTGINDRAVDERETKIINKQKEVKSKIETLASNVSQYVENYKYEEAIQCCNELLELDITNKTKWTSRIADIRSKQAKQIENSQRLENLDKEIRSAQWNEDWSKLEKLCNEYLEIRQDDGIADLLRRVTGKLSADRELEAIKQIIAEINDLIVHAEFKLAKEKLKQMERGNLPIEIRRQAKDLWKTLFAREDEAETTKKVRSNPILMADTNTSSVQEKEVTQHRPVIGFRQSPESTEQKKKDNFFDEPNPRHSQKSKSSGTQKKKTDDGFFDDIASSPKEKKRNESPVVKGQITNDDFNF